MSDGCFDSSSRLDMETLGFYLFMEEQERKQAESQQLCDDETCDDEED